MFVIKSKTTAKIIIGIFKFRNKLVNQSKTQVVNVKFIFML